MEKELLSDTEKIEKKLKGNGTFSMVLGVLKTIGIILVCIETKSLLPLLAIFFGFSYFYFGLKLSAVGVKADKKTRKFLILLIIFALINSILEWTAGGKALISTFLFAYSLITLYLLNGYLKDRKKDLQP